MMEFAENELLQLVGCLAFLGVDPGLRKQGLGVDAGLLQQQAKTVILRRQRRLMGGAGRRFDRRTRMDLLAGPHQGSSRNDIQCAGTYHRLQFGNHLLVAQRLAEETTVGRPFGVGWLHLTGHQDDLDVGPAACTAWASFRPSMLPGI